MKRRGTINEDCPKCGLPLSRFAEAIRVKPSTATAIIASTACSSGDTIVGETGAIRSKPAFSLASDYYYYYYGASSGNGLTFGIKELDKRFSLQVGECSCIHGSYSCMLIERLCARALMPSKSGDGLGSNQVIFIDGGNSSDVYLFVEYARMFGLDYRYALKRVVQSRAFTVYQLVDLITNHLSGVIETTKAKAVFIADPFEMFEREPNLDSDEGLRLASKIVLALRRILLQPLSKLQKNVAAIVISLSHKSRYDISLAKFGKHLFVEDVSGRLGGFATIHLQDGYGRLALKVAGLV
jgi:hypothetical protein